MKKKWLIFGIFCWFIGSAIAQASVIYVDVDATGNNSGYDWQNAYTSLQSALGTATSGDEIWVSEGTYKPTSGTDRFAYFEMASGVDVYGGFSGVETQLNQRDPDGNVTTLSGDIGTQGVDTDNSYNVLFIDNVSNTTALDGFTVTKGYANYTTPGHRARFGGGIMCGTNCDLQTGNLVVKENYAIAAGGGIYFASGSDALLRASTVESNTSGGYGGGIAIVGGAPIITETVITNNTATTTGGAIRYLDGNIDREWSELTVTGNSAAKGGGIYTDGGSYILTITDSTFNNNSASGSSIANGGAIQIESGAKLEARSVKFENNSAQGWGGALYLHTTNAAFKVIDCQFIGNTSSSSLFGGGAIYFEHRQTLTNTLDVINSLFAGNSSNDGGGAIYVQEGCGLSCTPPLSIYDSTFVANTATTYGGGIGRYTSGGWGVFTVANSIFWDNEDSTGQGTSAQLLDHNANMGTVNYSDIEGGWTVNGSGNINSDPSFVNAANDNYRLGENSPAKNVGDNNSIPSGITTDLDQANRILDTTVDLGAYEYNAPLMSNANSLRTHGSNEYPIALSLTNPTTETRSSGPQKFEIVFTEPIFATDGTLSSNEVSLSSGTLGTLSTSNNSLFVNLSGVSDQSCLTVTLSGLEDDNHYPLAGDDDLKIRALTADTTNDGVVNIVDLSDVKLKVESGTPASSAPQCDLNTDDAINSTDQTVAQSNLWHTATCS